MILRVVSNSKNSNRNNTDQSQTQSVSEANGKGDSAKYNSSNSRTGDWDNHPEVWREVNDNSMWKDTIYENMTPQDRYNYQTNNANHWASIEGIQH